MATEATIKKILLGCWARYPNPPHDPNQQALIIAAWVDDLKEIDDTPLLIAARQYWLEPNQWSPAPGFLRGLALRVMGADADSRAIAAWSWLSDYVYCLLKNDNGEELAEYYARHGKDDAAVAALREIGGAEAFNERDRKFDWQLRQRFIEIYKDRAAKQDLVMLPEFQALKLLK